MSDGQGRSIGSRLAQQSRGNVPDDAARGRVFRTERLDTDGLDVASVAPVINSACERSQRKFTPLRDSGL